ncbi:MAG TPA: DM13 domain-containing protein [Gaiellaceae bacterium]|nr:DM13 domain-containing protein [Gaiellaceae bacterium]
MTSHALTSRAIPLWLRLILVPVSAFVVGLGIWVTGAVVTNDFRTSMGLTALWFAIVAAVALVVWRRWPALRLPVSAVAVGTFVLVGGYLVVASVRDVKVNEIVVAGPALLEGSFAAHAHPTDGVARIVETSSGRVLTLTSFETDPGPDLYVYVASSRTSGDDVDGSTQLARLKGNIGNQQYELPSELDVAGGATVVIWCRAFSVSFGAAQLSPT